MLNFIRRNNRPSTCEGCPEWSRREGCGILATVLSGLAKAGDSARITVEYNKSGVRGIEVDLREQASSEPSIEEVQEHAEHRLLPALEIARDIARANPQVPGSCSVVEIGKTTLGTLE